MARYSIAGRSTIAGTTLRGQFSIYSVAGSGFALREVGVFNTTSTALAIALVRFTATGTQGAALTEGEYHEDAPVPLATGFAGHTADATVGQVIRQASLGAAIGSGVIWTFGDTGLVVQPGTANGIGIIIPTGTGQICDYYADWDE
jgi:hypothetical protein